MALFDRRALLAGLLAAPTATPSLAQVVAQVPVLATPTILTPRRRNLFALEGRYLQHVKDLIGDDPTGADGQILALIGDEHAVFRLLPSPVRTGGVTPNLSGAHAADAIETIVDAARGRRVVILNEAHHVSRDRAFAHALALRLRREGFDWFAAETFMPELAESLRAKPGAPWLAESAVWDRPAPPGAPVTTDAGFYTADPVFAELTRGVRDAAFRLFAYEQRREQRAPVGASEQARAEAREQAEAENLAWLLTRRPNARVLVYCGYGHACKVPPDGVVRMAARLKTITGIDPLTIDQSWGAPGPERALESPVLTPVLDQLKPTRPVCAWLGDDSPLILFAPYRGGFDLAVIHPRLPYIRGRPGWLARAPGRRFAVAALPAGIPAGALAQAVPTTELARAANTVPSDQYPLAAGARQATFLLRPGDYTVRVETPDGLIAAGRLQVGRG